MIRFFTFLTLLFFITMAAAAADKFSYLGHYWNEEKNGIFMLHMLDGNIEGTTVWGKNPSKDVNNPDLSLRDRPLSGIKFLWGFTYDAKKNRWVDGKVYDPNNGKTYSAKMSLENDGYTLKMRGYIGVALFGRTAKFERVNSEDMPDGMTGEMVETAAEELNR